MADGVTVKLEGVDALIKALAEATKAEARIGQPWDRGEELARLRRRQQELDEILAATAQDPPAAEAVGLDARVSQAVDDDGAGGPRMAGPLQGPTTAGSVAAVEARLDALQQRRHGPAVEFDQ